MSRPFEPEQEQVLAALAQRYPRPEMGLLEALRRAQEWHRRVTDDDEEYLAGLFGVGRRRVRELATFFPLFTRQAAGRHRIGLCRGLSCSLAGADEACRCLERKLGVREGEVTPDGRFSFERVECLGACDHAPALMVDEELQGRASEELVDELLRRLP